jgi:hypothetical protein
MLARRALRVDGDASAVGRPRDTRALHPTASLQPLAVADGCRKCPMQAGESGARVELDQLWQCRAQRRVQLVQLSTLTVDFQSWRGHFSTELSTRKAALAGLTDQLQQEVAHASPSCRRRARPLTTRGRAGRGARAGRAAVRALACADRCRHGRRPHQHGPVRHPRAAAGAVPSLADCGGPGVGGGRVGKPTTAIGGPPVAAWRARPAVTWADAAADAAGPRCDLRCIPTVGVRPTSATGPSPTAHGWA